MNLGSAADGYGPFKFTILARSITGRDRAIDFWPHLDENCKPRGARFSEVRDDIVTAALDMKCWVVNPASEDFVPLGMKLPVGRLYASGRAFIPNIRRDLYDRLFATKGKNAAFLQKAEAEKTEGSTASGDASSSKVACVSPMTSGLPRSWDNVGVGHMVLVHESQADGWWEAVVVQREDEVLTLRFRDYPKLPTFVRHISTIALVNPGPTAQAT
jgi:hypothetical protein